MNEEDRRIEKLKYLAAQYEINGQLISKIRTLEAFDIVLLCDDSGSMATQIDEGVADPYAKRRTRWDELKSTVGIVVEIASALDKLGVDIFFLNRAPLMGIRSANDVNVAFQYPPQGYTPTVDALNVILQQKATSLREKKVLLILATDGEPTDSQGNGDSKRFDHWVRNMPDNLYLSIVACTDNKKDIRHLDKLAGKVNRVDIIDEFRLERAEVLEKHGKNFKFTFGDYVSKILLGPIDRSINMSAAKMKKDCNMM